MVYAFLIHSLLPGQCSVLFHSVFGQEEGDSTAALSRKNQMERVARSVHSEYQFRRAVSGRSVDEDILRTSDGESGVPELERGLLRLVAPFRTEKVVVWCGAGSTGFSLVCEPSENRLLADVVLRLVVRHLLDHLPAFSQPAEVLLKPDRVLQVVQQFLPDGHLVFMNHRVVRQMERELENCMKGPV